MTPIGVRGLAEVAFLGTDAKVAGMEIIVAIVWIVGVFQPATWRGGDTQSREGEFAVL